MKNPLSPYRCPKRVTEIAEKIHATAKQPWTIMEVCGGQTNSIVKHGLDQLLAPSVNFIHGPGCPVCVTPSQTLSQAIALSQRPNTILCTFGDMLRVPTDRDQPVKSLLAAKAQGAQVQVIYSPEEAVTLAEQQPHKDIVLLAVGFETTTPATAIAAISALNKGLNNFFMLVAHVQVPAALKALISTPDHHIDAFLAAGHVCTIMGTQDYPAISAQGRLPIVITGFEPVDILEGVFAAVHQLENNKACVENKYTRYVSYAGNIAAQKIVHTVYRPATQLWRGLGEMPESGWQLKPAFQHFSAEQLLTDSVQHHNTPTQQPPVTVPPQTTQNCQAGAVLTGKLKPCDCPHFGKGCRPQHPLGAPMVSDEGACAAYFHYRDPIPTP